MRSEPSTSGARIGEIPAGGTFSVLEGPICANGYTWWRVEYFNLLGWTVEGDGTVYWLEPAGPPPTAFPTFTPSPTWTHTPTLTPSPTFTHTPVATPTAVLPPAQSINIDVNALFHTPLPTELVPITAENAADVRPLSLFSLGGVTGIEWSPDGNTLAVRSSVGVWLINDEHPFPGLLLDTQNLSVSDMTFSPDGRTLAVGGRVDDGSTVDTVQLWNVATGTISHRLQSPPQWVFALEYSPDGRLLATGSNLDYAQLWEANTGRLISNLGRSGASNAQGPARDVTFSPDGSLLAVNSGMFIRIWNMERMEHQIEYQIFDAFQSALTFNASGDILYSGGAVSFGNGEQGIVRAWNVLTSQRIELQAPEVEAEITSLAVNQDYSMMALRSDYLMSRIWLWDMQTQQLIDTLDMPQRVFDVIFAPDGSLTIALEDGTIHRLEFETGSDELMLEYGMWEIRPIAAVNADNTLLALYDMTQSGVQIWELSTRRLVNSFQGLLGTPVLLEFQANGETLMVDLANTSRGYIRQLWNWQTEEITNDQAEPVDNEARRLLAEGLLPGRELRTVMPFAASELLALTDRTTLQIWDARERLPIARINFIGDVIAISPDHRLLVTSSNGLVLLWGITP